MNIFKKQLAHASDMTTLIEQIKLKADSIPTNTKENRRAKGAYVDCLMMVKEANKNFIKSGVVGQGEQLLAFKKWEAEKCKLPWDASPEQIIEQYLIQ